MRASMIYTEKAIENAKANKMLLVKIALDSKYIDGGGTWTITGPVGPKMAKRIKRLFLDLHDAEKSQR